MSRKRKTGILRNEQYRKLLQERNLEFAEVNVTPIMRYPDADQSRQVLTFEAHTWQQGDRYWKIADKFWRQPAYWYVLAFYNARPVEATIRPGTTIYVPTPLTAALSLMKR